MKLDKLGLILMVHQYLWLFGYGSNNTIIFSRGFNAMNKVEIINIDDPSFHMEIPDVPVGAMNGQGWMVNDYTLMLCGGATHENDECHDSQCFAYNFKDKTWSETIPQPKAQTANSETVKVDDAGFWVIGGTQNEYDGPENCDLVEVKTTKIFTFDEKWIPGPEIPYDVNKGCAVQIDYQRTYIAGTEFAYIYDWETREFWEIEPIPDNGWRREEASCGYDSQSGKVVIVGGELIQHDVHFTSSVKLYDPLTNSYSDGPEFPYKIRKAAMVNIKGRLVISGGQKVFKATNDLHLYSPQGWIKLNVTMKYPRYYHDAIALD